MTMEDAIMKKSIQFIEAHLTERLSLSLITCHVGYSEYHFSRVFREKMQCSVMEYVRKRRLFKAAENIMEGQKIVDVAYEYGWQSHNSFTRAFGAEYGFPPSTKTHCSSSWQNVFIICERFVLSSKVR